MTIKLQKNIRVLVFCLCVFHLPKVVFGSTLSGGQLIEDFSTVDHWDVTNSTGLWNIVDHSAQAGRVLGGSASFGLSFGDGSDGIVNSSTGYTFDTDSHPNGYNFISFKVTGGSISVSGSQPW